MEKYPNRSYNDQRKIFQNQVLLEKRFLLKEKSVNYVKSIGEIMVKVSVVIPVYNVEKYLEDCLNSIVNQTLKDIEIICINDGSTDNSLEILNRYAQKDKRITVISQKNQGHAVATNKGISMAKGEYLYLMDSDDIVKLNALEDTYFLSKSKDLDLLIFKAIKYSESENKVYENDVYNMDGLFNAVGNNVFSYKDIPSELLFDLSVTPWSKLYNRRFINEIGAKFPEGLVFDDNVFFWQVLFNCKRIYFHNEFLFTRRVYSSSSTASGDERYLDSIAIINLIGNEFRKYGEFEHHKVTLYNKKVVLGHFRFKHIRDEFKNLYFDAWKKDLLDVSKDKELFSDFFNNLSSDNKKIVEMVLAAESGDEFELLKEDYFS